ncbi:MAG: hypothetical protein HN356_06025 [Calditrichaeota bacterium]|nr:hypothetical protein [Calditrichota bacterium]
MKSLTTICILLFLLITVLSAVAETKPYGAETHFLSDPKPIQTEWSGNPLDYAAGRIGLDVRGIELPRGYEGGYRFACRFPIIDYVSNRPLYMKQWTEENAERILAVQQENGLVVINFMLELLNDSDKLESTIPGRASSYFRGYLRNSAFTPKYQFILSSLLTSFTYVKRIIEIEVNEQLPQETREFFAENLSAYLLPDGERMNSLTGNVDSQFKYIEHARKVNHERIFVAACQFADAVDRYLQATQNFGITDYYSDNTKSNETYIIDGIWGVISGGEPWLEDTLGVVISGFGNDTHTENTGMIIDLGGNDLYTNNAGGTIGSTALVIDHKGDDAYNSDSNYVQGFGCLGVGYLVDLEGNDRYTAKHFSQGGGIMGVGCLWDNWGNDEYSGHGFTQGAAMFGLGALLDNSGDDKYDCATLGQGGATTLGLGICSDLSGDDEYLLNVTKGKDNMGSAGYGQGGALSFRHNPWNKKLTAYGGVGFLIDGNGDDSYHTKGWCDQGGSYIMSLGALYDGGGNDKYIANTGQGSGIHITNAILIDKSGNDNYQGGFRTGASGSDRSPGILIDYAGDDTYQSKSSCYGTGCKPFSFSLMIDYKGDDTYISPNPKGPILMNNWDAFGGVWPESASYLWPWAMCLDLGGKDDYQVRNRANNSERHSFGHGIHLDIEYEGGDIIGEVEKPLQFKDSQILDKIIRNNPETVDALNTLQSGSTFGSFRAIGKINSHSPDVVTDLVSVLLNSENRAFNRYVMECIQHFFSSDQITDEHVSDLQKLLKAKDPEVRTIMADNFGIWECSTTEGALIDALNDPEASVRRFSLSSLISLKSEAGLEHARKMAFDDPSEEVQRVCIVYISRMKEHVNAYPLLMRALKDDTAAAVKVAAASGLGSSGNQSAVGELKRASKSNDVYLQRAAGKALAELYQVEGIEILINSLTFPSIDAFYNYNRNVPNYLANYSGFNPPEKERYKQQLWLDWYTKNRDKIDIKSNVDAYNEYRVLQVRIASDIDSEKVRKLEQFLKKFPNHSGAGQFLASELNHIAWYMVTDAKGTPDWNPPLAVIFAERAVELSQEINYVDTLAEAYLADGRLNEAKMVCEKYPDNKMFTERLDRIKDSQDK